MRRWPVTTARCCSNPTTPMRWFIAAAPLTDLGRHDEAVAAYRKALASGGDAQRIRYSLACLGAEAVPKASPVEYVKATVRPVRRRLRRAPGRDAGIQDADAPRRRDARARDARRRARWMFWTWAAARACADRCCARSRARWWAWTCRRRCWRRRVSAAATTSSCAPNWRPTWLASRNASICGVAADVFVYIGDLSEVFTGMRKVLRPGGLFGFSVEAGDDETDFIAPAHPPLRPFARLPAPAGRGSRVCDRIGGVASDPQESRRRRVGVSGRHAARTLNRSRMHFSEVSAFRRTHHGPAKAGHDVQNGKNATGLLLSLK